MGSAFKAERLTMRISSLIPFFLLIGICLARQRKGSLADDNLPNKQAYDRDGKLFSLFTIVNFKNSPCVSSSSLSSGSTPYRNGTCYTASECSSKGGSSKGNCASGFGVCCIFLYDSTDQTTINYNDTYIQNPSYPSTYGETNSLTYTVNKCSDDVCFLRLDFETFVNQGPSDTNEAAAAPDAASACTDTFTVTTSTSGTTYPSICGDNTGQHIYVDIGSGSSDTATLAFAFTGSSTSRKWDIKVAQIPCSQTYSPPAGCLQYSTGMTGQITTFNFANSAGPHLPNQNYQHCVRQEAGMCCVEYSVCSTDLDQFSLDNDGDATTATNAKSVVGSSCVVAATAGSTAFTGDYIEIDGSGGTCGDTTGSRYCGQALHVVKDLTTSIPICDCTAPFAVRVVTDDLREAGSDKTANRGICLNYRQLPC